MSWEHIQAAFNYKGEGLGEVALHVLLRIAFEIRDNGYSFPSTQYIADKIHTSRKTVQRAINELRASGALEVRSGRESGHKNHYFIDIQKLALGTRRSSPKNESELSTDVHKALDNFGRKPCRDIGEGRICPTPLGQKRRDVGQTRLLTWDKNDPVRRNIEKENQETVRPIQEAVFVPPLDGTVHRLPPTGTVEFKSFAVRFAMNAGASLVEARRFYEHNQAENWRVLEEMPLEVAAAEHVKAWKERDPRAFLTEQISRIKESGR